MVKLVKLATCNLNQWSLDFDLNLANIFRSIHEAKSLGCRFRTGPELEVSGYGCEDHFLEEDTIKHCWESIHALLTSDATDDMLVDVGMPLLHKRCSLQLSSLPAEPSRPPHPSEDVPRDGWQLPGGEMVHRMEEKGSGSVHATKKHSLTDGSALVSYW